jgi:hypothetical protein
LVIALVRLLHNAGHFSHWRVRFSFHALTLRDPIGKQLPVVAQLTFRLSDKLPLAPGGLSGTDADNRGRRIET